MLTRSLWWPRSWHSWLALRAGKPSHTLKLHCECWWSVVLSVWYWSPGTADENEHVTLAPKHWTTMTPKHSVVCGERNTFSPDGWCSELAKQGSGWTRGGNVLKSGGVRGPENIRTIWEKKQLRCWAWAKQLQDTMMWYSTKMRRNWAVYCTIPVPFQGERRWLHANIEPLPKHASCVVT